MVSRDSVRISFLIASLNDLDICDCDIGKSYLNAKFRERLWTVSGTYFGPSDRESVMIIARALYGLKYSGSAWRAKPAKTLNSMGYQYIESDPDVWFKQAVNTSGREYYKYMLVYVYKILLLGHDPKEYMDALNHTYRLKE